LRAGAPTDINDCKKINHCIRGEAGASESEASSDGSIEYDFSSTEDHIVKSMPERKKTKHHGTHVGAGAEA